MCIPDAIVTRGEENPWFWCWEDHASMAKAYLDIKPLLENSRQATSVLLLGRKIHIVTHQHKSQPWNCQTCTLNSQQYDARGKKTL